MNGYVVYNGWTGFSAVRVFVVAPDAETARQLAEARFKATDDAARHGEKYWNTLTVEQVTTGIGASEVSD